MADLLLVILTVLTVAAGAALVWAYLRDRDTCPNCGGLLWPRHFGRSPDCEPRVVCTVCGRVIDELQPAPDSGAEEGAWRP